MNNLFRVHNNVKEGQATRVYSDKQEKAVAKLVNGVQTKNSGATLFQKSDVLTKLFTIECKTKTKNSDSISIKKEWFDKQVSESIQMGRKYNAIVINFGPDAPYNENHFIINETLFQKLVAYLEAENSHDN